MECESFLTSFEVNRALKAVSKILNSELAPAKLLIFLLVFAKNSSNCSKYGVEITDTIANWSPKGFVAGAFKAPPLSTYRVNPLMAVDQGKKIRPVLNVSLPENASFNDNINFFEMEKVSMSTARRFGFSLCEAGYFAKMSKFDFVDAYKIIPAPLDDFRLQGFCWLQKYFVELKQIFGAKTAVANFDIFGNTILSLAVAGTNFPKNFIHRCLDDVPFAAPAHTSWCEKLTSKYSSICGSLNVKFVSSCLKNEKAFSNSTFGKVLGIFFDSSDLSWSLPEAKRIEALMSIKKVITKDFLVLSEMQEMLGRLNHINQMCNFLQGFMFPLYIDLSELLNENSGNYVFNQQSRKDLNIWINFLLEGASRIPICRRYYNPPLSYKSFSSDAAGCSKPSESGDLIGCGSVGFDRMGHIIFAFQLFWPPSVIGYFRDNLGHRLGQQDYNPRILRNSFAIHPDPKTAVEPSD